MNKYDKKRKYCIKCTENFYNGNNPYGIKECWYLSNAKVVQQKIVPLDQSPPWKQKASRVLSCQRIEGCALVSPDREH